MDLNLPLGLWVWLSPRVMAATLMPGLVKNHRPRHQHQRVSFHETRSVHHQPKVVLEVLADAWLAGLRSAARNLLLDLKIVEGLKIRSAGANIAEMLGRVLAASIGGSIPSSEVYSAIATRRGTGAPDTSAGAGVSFRLYEQFELFDSAERSGPMDSCTRPVFDLTKGMATLAMMRRKLL